MQAVVHGDELRARGCPSEQRANCRRVERALPHVEQPQLPASHDGLEQAAAVGQAARGVGQ
jgi:hypothetical protein